MSEADVIIIGGGVVGLAVAYELAGQGAAVRVFDKGRFGQEASWAGAGILPPGNREFATTPESMLRSESHRLWPEWNDRLVDETGIDTGLRRCGGLTVRLNGHAGELAHEIEAWRDEGVSVEEPTLEQAFDLEPNLSREITSVFRLPELAQVRNPRYLKALMSVCIRRGVVLSAGQPVTGFDMRHDRVVGVRTSEGSQTAGRFCVAGGAWSRGLLQSARVDVGIQPVRGQIVMLAAPPGCLRHVIEVGPRYLVPRPDGRVLIGSTEELVGFDKRNTAEAVSELIRFATSLVPALADATFERSWCGLRPGTSARVPFLCRVPEIENLTIAAGHFRSGLQMSPATAVFMRQLILEQKTCLPREPFEIDRDTQPSDETVAVNSAVQTHQ